MGPERLLQAVGLSVPPLRRARFMEEWQADLAAARLLGLSPWGMVAAAARVALFLLWLHVREQVSKPRSRSDVVRAGIGAGALLVLADVQIAVLVPFVVIVLGCWTWRRVRRWIDLGR